jgi:O-antigen/teichoic acid export membrane protein
MQLGHRLGRAIAWNILAAGSTAGANLVAAVILANILGRDVFGELGIVQSTIMSVGGIAQLATGLAATKYVAEYRLERKESAGEVLGLCAAATALTGAFGAIVLYLSAKVVATSVLGAPELVESMGLASGVVLFLTMNGFQAGALAGLENYRSIAIISASHAVLHVSICAASGWMGGLRGVLIGLIVSSAVRWVLFNAALRKEARRQGIEISMKRLGSEAKVVATFATPAALAGMSALLATWAGNAILVRQESGIGQMGLYAAANSLRGIVLFLPALVNNVGVSVINNFYGSRHLGGYRAAFWGNFWVTCVSLLMGAPILLLFGEPVLRAFGRDFIEAVPLLRVVFFSALLEGLSVAAYQIVLSRARIWTALYVISLPRDCLIVGLAWLLVPKSGALGLALSQAMSYAVALLLTLWLASNIGFGTETLDNTKIRGNA